MAGQASLSAMSSLKESRQLSPDEHWEWGQDPSLLQHWHGRWRTWYPLDSPQFVRSVKSVRSLISAAPDLSRYTHKNDWYDREGTPTPLQSAGNEWEVVRDEHSLPDGIVHPARATSRRYCVNREGEGVWAPLKAEGPSERLLAELFFRRGPDARLGSVLGFLPNGTFMSSLALEQARETADRPDPSWTGIFSPIPDSLPSSLPVIPTNGKPGTRSTMTRYLEYTEEEVPFLGSFFPPGIAESEQGDYVLVSLPERLVLSAPKSLQCVWGRTFAYCGTWVMDDGEIKRLAVFYGPDGELLHAVGEHYKS